MSTSGARPRSDRLTFLGRGGELAGLRELYGEASAGRPRLVVVEGPAGIGKSALIRHFVDQTARGRVLTASGEEQEAALPYGVLTQLTGGPVHTDPLTAGAGLLEPLSDLQSVDPVVVVLDDGHWADAPSLRALTFALRRLRADRVLCLLAVRDADDPRIPEGLRRVIADDSTVRLRLGGLSVADVGELSARLLPEPLPPAVALRLHAHTDGNPLHCRALLEEVPAAALRSPEIPLPAPHAYTSLVLDQLTRCGPPARGLVQAAAVLGSSCALARTAALAGVAEPLAALAEALVHGLLREAPLGGVTVVAFTHPLVRAAVYHQLGPVRRTALHIKAAETEDDEFTRLHHRVLAALGPDDALSSELADCARRRTVQGRWAEVPQLLRYAARLSVRPRDRGRLDGAAVEALLFDGRVAEAGSVLDSLPEETHATVRCCARAHLALVAGRVEQARTLLDEAWKQRLPGADPELEARIAEQSVTVHMMFGQGSQAIRWAELAQRITGRDRVGGTTRFIHMAALGQVGRYEEAFRLGAGLPDVPLVAAGDVDLLIGRGVLHMYGDRPDRARADLAHAVDLVRQGPAPLRVVALALLAKAEYLNGAWDLATLHWEASSTVAAELGQTWIAPVVLAEAALPLAARGDFGRAGEYLRTARAAPVFPESAMVQIFVAYGTAFRSLVLGDPAAAAVSLRPLLAHEDLDFTAETTAMPWRDLLADALIRSGERDEAEQLLDALEERARRRARASTLAAVCRLRGTLYGARRENKRAQDAFAEALDRSHDLGIPFEQARVDLDFGAFLRRAGRRGSALERLRVARSRFEELGAVPFLAACDRELSACGAPPAGTPAPRLRVREQLTAQEYAVARLAATGLTNRQIARELILSAKTVEYHLSHVYAKLGIRSRVELVARVGAAVAPATGEGSGTAG
ncbi:LuxR C-terminal-related transcriptional regulator [Streptomyces sp. NPDC051940]|uniref:LuxR C-terminal-related transcriptional regulator n=1 Tax=Streptomyces sp. NPDC051940 TaxID=3155675 RepID=UPI003431596A